MTVERIISYLCTLDYGNEENPEEKTARFSSVPVYTIAYIYNVPELKRLTKRRFEGWAGRTVHMRNFLLLLKKSSSQLQAATEDSMISCANFLETILEPSWNIKHGTSKKPGTLVVSSLPPWA